MYKKSVEIFGARRRKKVNMYIQTAFRDKVHTYKWMHSENLTYAEQNAQISNYMWNSTKGRKQFTPNVWEWESKKCWLRRFMSKQCDKHTERPRVDTKKSKKETKSRYEENEKRDQESRRRKWKGNSRYNEKLNIGDSRNLSIQAAHGTERCAAMKIDDNANYQRRHMKLYPIAFFLLWEMKNERGLTSK